MARKFAVLRRIDNEHPVTRDTDGAFLFHLQGALLLALQECGRLSDTQYRYAVEQLNRQRQQWGMGR